MNKYTLLICLLFAVKIFSQQDIPGLIYRGLDYSYNFQFQEAENTFQQIINKYPEDPRGYHYKSSIYLWTYLSNKDRQDYDRFMKLSDIAIDKADKLLDRNDNDENALFVLGSNYGMRAMAFTKDNSTLNAVWAAKNSNKYLNRTLEKYPYNNDVYLGKGLFSFAFSFVPGVFKWALNLAGLSGNREEGISFLQKSLKYGKYTKTEAAYYLSQIYSEMHTDYDAALSCLKPVIAKYPSNTLFRYSEAVVFIKSRKPQEAEKSLREIIRLNNPKFRQVTAFSWFLLGDIMFHRNEFQAAINNYQKFLTSTNDIDYSGIAYLRIGLSYELMRNRTEAMRNYILARNGNLDIADDSYAKRKGEWYYDHPVNDAEAVLIKSSNNLESGKPAEAYEQLVQMLPRMNTQRLKAEAYLYLSDAAQETGKYSEAVDFASKAASNEIKEEKWIRPFAYYFGARAYYRSGNKNMAKKYLDYADDYSDFDYQSKLTGLIKGLRGKI